MDIGNISFLGLIFGMFGTTLGGILGAILNIKSIKFISFSRSYDSCYMF